MNREEVARILRDDVERAKAVSETASAEFEAILNDIPSSIPHPDGALRIRNASIESAAARTHFMHAIKRQAAFLVHGTLPEDLPE